MPVIPEVAVPYVEEAGLTVDGRADEAAWAGALVVEDFLAFQPRPGEAPTGKTTARILADGQGIWFHFTADDPEPDKVRAGLGRRDTRFGDDWCALYLDPAGDAQRAYLFLVNPLGVQADGTNVSGAPEDVSWDGRWVSAGRRTERGYEVELGIPWRTVRHPAVADRVGLFLFRHVARLGEKSSWPVLDPAVAGLLAQEAVVGGPGRLPKTLGLDVVPELTFGVDQDGPADDRLGVGGVGPGGLVRWAPDPAFTLLGTVNPDFSQVESDASQIDVNRRYALYYPEKRTFFLEGQEWFNHPFDGLVYTRSMVAPLAGARATTEAGGWTAAALHVVDRDPRGSFVETGGWTDEDLAGAYALDTVARLRRSLGPDRYVGLVLSDKTVPDRDLRSTLGGVDLQLRLSDRWVASGAALGSSTTSPDGAALAPAGVGSLSYSSKHASFGARADLIAPDFRAENGFLTETDRISAGTWAGVVAFTGVDALPRLHLDLLSASGALTADGAPKRGRLNPSVTAILGNGGYVYGEAAHTTEAFADTWLSYDRGVVDSSVPWARWLSTGAGAAVGTGPLYDPLAPTTGWQDDVWGAVELQPIPALSLTLTGSWERFELEGEELYEGWVGRARLEAFASRRLWARLIADRSSFEGVASGQALVAWERSPGSAFYLGGSGRVADPTAPVPSTAPDEWAVFAKGSWVFAG